MADVTTNGGSIPHVERTAKDPRQEGLHRVFIGDVKEINVNVRIITLRLPQDEVRRLWEQR